MWIVRMNANASYFFYCYVQKFWCFVFDRFVDFLHERNNLTKQFSKFDHFFCFRDWIKKRKQKNLEQKWQTKFHTKMKKSKKIKKWMNETKKEKKKKNEKNETLIFYLTKKSIFSNFIQFVIFVITFSFNLNEFW